jgi:hypothetical protein
MALMKRRGRFPAAVHSAIWTDSKQFASLHPLFYQWNQCDLWSLSSSLVAAKRRRAASLWFKNRIAEKCR